MSSSSSTTVTTQRAWAKLMQQMSGTNLSRARQARRVANLFPAYWKRH